jgi:thiamine transporter ThiT
MALRSGLSHSMATLLLGIISALLIKFLSKIGIFDRFFDYLLGLSDKFSNWLEKTMEIKISHELFPIIFVATLLAFLWGVIYHIRRH